MDDSEEPICDLCVAAPVANPRNGRVRYLPDIAPLTDFHVLLVTPEHSTAFADIAGDRYLAQVCALLEHLRREGHFAVAFEHGSPTPFIGGLSGKCNSTEHAHIHVVSYPADIFGEAWNAVEKEMAVRVRQESPWAAPKPTQTGYIWLADCSRSAQFEPVGAIPRQLMRRIILDILPPEAKIGRFANWRDQLFFSEELSEQSRVQARRQLDHALSLDYERR